MAIEIDDIKTLALKPGQVLVVQANGLLPRETLNRIRDVFSAELPDISGRLLVIDKSISLSIIDPQG